MISEKMKCMRALLESIGSWRETVMPVFVYVIFLSLARFHMSHCACVPVCTGACIRRTCGCVRAR